MENKKSINFFSSSDNATYNMFILPHICSVLYHVENSYCELVIKDSDIFIKENKAALELIDEEYPNRVVIREIPNKFIFLESIYVHLGQLVRFLDIPELKTDYTYIGDIDIINMDGNIISIHEKLMKLQELSYSNIVRPNTIRLTGCIFVDYEKYYSKVKSSIDKFMSNTKKFYHPILSDEILLYKLVTPVLGVPKYNDNKFRPIHGIHMSLNRPEPLGGDGVPGWGVNKKTLSQYNEFKNSSLYKTIYPFFYESFKTMISKLDNLPL